MIVRDEAATIGAVLADAGQFCDELIVLDTGSVDETVEIARAGGATVHEFVWIDDFAAARNASFAHCTGDWILWLDADDRVPAAAQAGFRDLKNELRGRHDLDGIMVPYHRGFAASDPSICTFSFDRERVLRRSAGLRWECAVHEVIGLRHDRSIRWPDAFVEHRPPVESLERKSHRNIRILEGMVGSGDRSPRTLFYYGNELREHGRHEEALAVYGEYIERGTLGWERYSALLHMATCCDELDRHEEKVQHLLAAVHFDSARAEAFNRLGMHFYDRKEWRRAIAFFGGASVVERPNEGFINDSDYADLPLDYLAVCLSHLGRDREALEYTLRAIVTAPDRERLLTNVDYYRARLAAHGDEQKP